MTREMAEETLQEELEARYRELFARNNPKQVPTRHQILVKALGKHSSPPWCFGEATFSHGVHRDSGASLRR